LTEIASIEIEGMDKLVAKLERLGMNVPRILRTTGKDGMMIYVEGPAKEKCPVDEGRLRGSIVTVVENDGVKTGTNVKYGPYVEFGTGLYAESGQGRKTPWVYYYSGHKGRAGFRMTRGQFAHPFLRPAWDNGKKNVVEHVRAQLRKAIAAS
jgi:HK97 gp10 family phage protein